MSLAGIRSNRGDAYQRAIATYWVVKMLTSKSEINSVQVDLVSNPGISDCVYTDDIAVTFNSGLTFYIQAKINQKDQKAWSITDTVLSKELVNAKSQLEIDGKCEIHFYSATPFADLEKLIKEIELHYDLNAFKKNASKANVAIFQRLALIWQLDDSTALNFLKRIRLSSHNTVDMWEQQTLLMLKNHFSRPSLAYKLIYYFVDKHHAKLSVSQFSINKKLVLDYLSEDGIYQYKSFDQQEFCRQLKQFSVNCMSWVRTIGGEVIQRPELDTLLKAIENKRTSVLLEDVAGGGKTCILLDLIDNLEKQANIESLFIRGDQYSSINAIHDLSKLGLPNDLIGKCAALAELNQLVVVIDSLDVLATGRSHNALRCFLAFISELIKIPNITVIAAARSFDVKYDPNLREADWELKIQMQPLTFDVDICPLLQKWQIDPQDIKPQLQTLITNPQNLRLFHELTFRGLTPQDINEKDLFEAYINEVIAKDPELGINVVIELQNLTKQLLENRGYEFSRPELNLSVKQVNRLISSEILVEGNGHQLKFSHQTIADALIIRQALKDNTSLVGFVLKQPQLPFIRPAIRTFIQSLRLIKPTSFARQFNNLIQHQDVAMHIKRLAVESLAEMSPRNTDLPLVVNLQSQQLNLFGRFLSQVNSHAWFEFLRDTLLAQHNWNLENNSTRAILDCVGRFHKGNEDWLLSLWNTAINEQWLDTGYLIWLITNQMQKLTDWHNPKIYPLLEQTLSLANTENGLVGECIGKYVACTGKGDELLWRYIVMGAKQLNEFDLPNELKINCQDYYLGSKTLLEERLSGSDSFFCLCMDFLLRQFYGLQSRDSRNPFRTLFLECTSYEMRHSKHDSYPHDPLHESMFAVEKALKYRAKTNDEVWRKYEAILREVHEQGLRYLVCEAYLENVGANLDGITYQLTDADTLRFSGLRFEICQLSISAYPHLPAKVCQKHQQLVNDMYNDDYEPNEIPKWVLEVKYEYFLALPHYLIEPKYVPFVTTYENKFGKYKLEPDVGSSGGFVRSPVPTEVLCQLNQTELVRLLQHYENYDDWSSYEGGGLVGGQSSLCTSLSDATEITPDKFINLLPDIVKFDLSIEYSLGIIRGVTNHLRGMYSNTQNQKSDDQARDGEQLATKLLYLINRYYDLDEKGFVTVKALQACSLVLSDHNSITQISFHLFKLLRHPNPSYEDDAKANSVLNLGINSVRGIAAETVMTICNIQLSQDNPLTSELKCLLREYASDKTMSVREAMKRPLVYLISREKKLGFQLMQQLHDEFSPELLKHFEPILYNNYKNNFKEIEPFLNLLGKVKDDKSASSWGRIAALCFITNKISETDLWCEIHNKNQHALVGFSQVFNSNLDNSEFTDKCLSGLLRVMEVIPPELSHLVISRKLLKKNKLKLLPLELIRLHIEALSTSKHPEHEVIFAWLELHVNSKYLMVLEMLEQLTNSLVSSTGRIYFHRPVKQISIINSLLKQADLSDDSIFIDRVLAIQDWFYSHGVTELEELLEN